MITREQIERIAANCGVEVSYVEAGKGGFIIDSTNMKYESLTDIVMDYFGTSNGNRKNIPYLMKICFWQHRRIYE